MCAEWWSTIGRLLKSHEMENIVSAIVKMDCKAIYSAKRVLSVSVMLVMRICQGIKKFKFELRDCDEGLWNQLPDDQHDRVGIIWIGSDPATTSPGKHIH